MPWGVSKNSGMAPHHTVGRVLVHLHVPDARRRLPERLVDVRAFERERRLAVLPASRASCTPSPSTTLPARWIASANAWSSAASLRCRREHHVEDDDGGARVGQIVGELGHAGARPRQRILELVDGLAVDPDDDDVVVGRRAGEQRVGRTALKAPEHLGGEPHPRDPGDHDREQENRHQSSNQHPAIHDLTLEQPNPPTWSTRPRLHRALRPSRDVAEHRGDGRTHRAEAHRDRARSSRPVQRPRQPTNRAAGSGLRPDHGLCAGDQIQLALTHARALRRGARSRPEPRVSRGDPAPPVRTSR